MTIIDRLSGLAPSVAYKAPVRAATTGAIALTGTQTIDGVALLIGDRVLVKDQAQPTDNGIWNVANGAWARAQDFNGARDVVRGTQVFVTAGTVNSRATFAVSTPDPVVIGTSAITFIGAAEQSLVIPTGGDTAVSLANLLGARIDARALGLTAGTDIAAGLETALDALDGVEIYFPPGTYNFSVPVETAAKSVRIDARHANFVSTGAGGLFRIVGEWDVTQTVSAISGRDFTVSDGTAFALGDVIKIYDDTIASDAEDVKQGEFAEVEAIVGNVITIGHDPYHTYTTAASAKISRLAKDHVVDIKIGRATQPTSGALSAELVWCESFLSPKVYVGRVDYTNFGVINLVGCHGGEARITRVDRSETSVGYGIVFTNSEGCKGHVGLARDMRHAIDMIGRAGATSGPASHGWTAFCTGTGRAEGCGGAAFAYHHGVRDCSYVDIHTRYCAGMVSFRGINNRVIGGSSYRDAAPWGAIQQTGKTASLTSGSLIQGVTVTEPTGVVLATSTKPGVVIVRGCEILCAHAVSPNRLFQVEGAGGALIMQDCRIRQTGTLSLRVVQVVDSAAGRVTLDNVKFDFSDATISNLRLVDNDIGATLTLQMQNVFIHNPDGAIFELYQAAAVPPAESYLADIIVTGTLTHIQEGQTVSALQTRIHGRITAGGAILADATT